MRKITFMLISLTLAQPCAYAEQKTDKAEATHCGPVTLYNQEINNLKVTGPTFLESVTVSGTLEVMGPVTIKECKVNDLNVVGPLNAKKLKMTSGEITGPAKFDRSLVESKLTVNGPLTAEESTFKDTIDIATNKMTLRQSHATSIHVRKNGDSTEKPQKVYLTDKTVVSGNITFEAGNGIVYLRKGAQLKGEVNGGKKVEKPLD